MPQREPIRFSEETFQKTLADLAHKDSSVRIGAMDSLRPQIHGLAREKREIELAAAVRGGIRALDKITVGVQDPETGVCVQDFDTRLLAAKLRAELSSAYRNYL
ncbi:hypothetical protein COY71_04055 [Candidatus Micrarchaeota archaeon CG_4_10_14_0_8_um_filter_60_7]|nr:MAG: hypothetical protein COY71_04055 [Candidatus Micrarchaeota archaeon CG_4_10_14_0_8_um_filter_60_7]